MDLETIPQPPACGGESAQEDVEPRQEAAGRVSEAAARPERRRRGGRSWPCRPNSPQRGEQEAREEAGPRRNNREGGCIPDNVWKLFHINKEEGTKPPPVGKNRLPITLGYRGTRVGEAKNPGPTVDLDMEILTSAGGDSQGDGDEGGKQGTQGKSRTPPKNTDTRTAGKTEGEKEETDCALLEITRANRKAKEEGNAR